MTQHFMQVVCPRCGGRTFENWGVAVEENGEVLARDATALLICTGCGHADYLAAFETRFYADGEREDGERVPPVIAALGCDWTGEYPPDDWDAPDWDAGH